ncbi:MAG: UDP-N-acetylmuramate--L-alanine ligase [Raineya sp.]|nr:UDP-N-acetylmuramate--L-alanine ligase [Raineya sp.]MDW8295742.1 UDP-N-acetylmuramate--L-alanine ligase [Raineya sp.]
MNLNNFEKVYFLGIGGIGMSALARWFKAYNYEVAGYDKTPSSITEQLSQEGINVIFEENTDLLPQNFIPENTLVVYTPAIPQENKLFQFFQEKDYKILKRAEALGLITQDNFTIAIAGTHGKTTTTSMVAHLLSFANKPVTAFVGGITQNYATNLLLSNEPNAYIVVEADEYDRSFLTLNPNIAVITATDADHLDIYQSHSAVQEAFEMFVRKIKVNGTLFYKNGLPLKIQNQIQTATFGLQKGEYQAKNIRMQDGNFVFDVLTPQSILENLVLQVPGYHNILNALAAIAVAQNLQIPDEVIQKGIAEFKGVKRRFEYILKTEKIIQIDDYAHHPEEIRAFLTAVRMLYPEKHITAIFQPHLYTRTRDFALEFSQALSLADRLILLDIYPAREKPIEGVSSKILLEKAQTTEKLLTTKENLLQFLKILDCEIVATIGAGDIDRLVQPIREILEKK